MEKNKETSKDDLGLSMIDTLRSSELSSIAKDLAEVGLDAILEDGVLKDVPVIGIITGIAKTAIAVRDKLLVKKLYSFLVEIKDVSFEERQKFINELDGNTNYRRKIGENLIMLLDRLDDLDKPSLVAKVFKAYMRGDINQHQLLRFESVIDKILVKDLENLLDALSTQKPSPDVFAEYLYQFGLSNVTFDDALYVKVGSGSKEIRHNNPAKFFPPKPPLQFHLSSMAYLLAQILIGEKIGDKDYIASNRKELESIKDKESG